MAYVQALAKFYPEQVLVFSSRSLGIPGTSVIASFSQYIKLAKVRSKVSTFDHIPAGIIANVFSDIIYIPYYGNILTKIPQVFSAYDMIYEKFPQYFPLSNPAINRHIQEKKKCFERAALILCISKNTANDILDIYPKLPDEKIRVVHLGVDELFFDNSSFSYTTEKPYFLYVGIRRFYKNFSRFLSAFGKSGLSKNFDLRLITPERYSSFTDPELDIIRQYDLSDHIKIETAVSDTTLHERYHQSFAFVYPSEYEGFGLPILEAMASGTLVLTSNVSSMPEIGDDVPLYFDPLSEDSIIQALLIASQMPEIQRQTHIQKGIARAKKFTWQNSQDDFLHTVQSLL
jgi:glycosyltransferase involved in cell wall biosynthesis